MRGRPRGFSVTVSRVNQMIYGLTINTDISISNIKCTVYHQLYLLYVNSININSVDHFALVEKKIKIEKERRLLLQP